MVLSKKQKILSGVGIVGGLSLLFLLLKSRLGYGDTPVEIWRNTPINTSSRIAHNRAENRDMRSIARSRTKWSEVEAERKQRKEDAETGAEARRREALWRRARRKIESN